LLIRGESGAGKSLMLIKLYIDKSKEFKDWKFILIYLKDLSSKNVKENINKKLIENGCQKEDRIILMLDGYDELQSN
jgi:hypothetical protein